MDNSLDKLLAFFGVLALVGYLIWETIKMLAIIVGVIVGVVIICIVIYFLVKFLIEKIYFNGKRFKKLKELLSENTQKCNDLNAHIADLTSRFSDYHSQDFGSSIYQDSSLYNYRRPLINQLKNNVNNEHYCSLEICRNAQNQPFKYLCKYFGIIPNESTLDFFESMFNDFSAAEEGKVILLQERQEILVRYKTYIPFFIRKFKKDLLFKELGYYDIDISDKHIPKYSFIYVSAGGYSSLRCDIVLDCDNLEKFIAYLASIVELSGTVEYQRSLMTKKLRNAIKKRDCFTCQKCGISILDEPHLLLEVDHIIPLSKGGVTTYENLQTLCWCCNRKKGGKLPM